MFIEQIDISPIIGVALGLEYSDDMELEGDKNRHYIVLDLLIFRFLFTLYNDK